MQTTDLVIDLERVGKIVTIARTIKPADDLGKSRTIEKLEIERRYWPAQGVDWDYPRIRSVGLVARMA